MALWCKPHLSCTSYVRLFLHYLYEFVVPCLVFMWLIDDGWLLGTIDCTKPFKELGSLWEEDFEICFFSYGCSFFLAVVFVNCMYRGSSINV